MKFKTKTPIIIHFTSSGQNRTRTVHNLNRICILFSNLNCRFPVNEPFLAINWYFSPKQYCAEETKEALKIWKRSAGRVSYIIWSPDLKALKVSKTRRIASAAREVNIVIWKNEYWLNYKKTKMRNKIQDNLGALSLQIVNSTAWKFCFKKVFEVWAVNLWLERRIKIFLLGSSFFITLPGYFNHERCWSIWTIRPVASQPITNKCYSWAFLEDSTWEALAWGKL